MFRRGSGLRVHAAADAPPRLQRLTRARSACRFAEQTWRRTGYDKHDPDTWAEKFLRMEPSMSVSLQAEAPRAFGAICDLVGGPERLDVATLTDTMICNLGGRTQKKGGGKKGLQEGEEPEWLSPLETARSGKGGWHKVLCAVAPRLPSTPPR